MGKVLVHYYSVLLISFVLYVYPCLLSPPVIYVGATGPVRDCEIVLTQVRGRVLHICVLYIYTLSHGWCSVLL